MVREDTSAPSEAQHAVELLELGDGLLELDAQWRIIRVNARQEQLSQKPRSETLGRSFAEVWPELATPESPYWREYSRCMAERVPVRFVAHYAALDAWFSVLAHPVSHGGIAVFFRDVTDQQRAEAALQRSEMEARAQAAQLEAILDCAADGLIVYDREGRTIRSTPAADEILGIPPRERLRPVQDRVMAQYEILTEDGRQLARDEMVAVRAAVHGETIRGAVLRVRSGDRPPRWLRMNAIPFALDGRPAGAVLSMTDITDRKRAEEALRESEHRLRAIFEDAAVGIVEVDEQDRFVAVNSRFCAMLGYEREELLGRRPHDFTAPEDLDTTNALIAKGHSGELRGFEYEKRYLRRDGSPLWVHVTVSVVRDASGRFLRAVGTAQDVTERRRADAALREANERLVEADRRKDEFLGMLSHELRNPLAPIRNALDILERSDHGGERARRARDVASRQVGHLTRLVDDLLDVTRIARGKIELRRAELDLGALARRTAEDYRALMQQRGLDLAVELPDAPLVASGDETRLAQVLGNLLSNAAKFTPTGGRVTLALHEDRGRAVIHVRDTGPGIAPELVETMFEPFTQGEQTLARSEGGLGLGLALVKGLVALHGGEVAARSAEGGGTDFVVTLPLASTPASRAAPAGAGAGPAAGSRRRVLVVDDNRDAAQTLAELVELLGHEAEVAHDGPGAVSAALASRPDVVLCDIGLPGMDGFAVARTLRARSADRLRLYAVSGYAQPEDVAMAEAAGFDGHLAKPLDPEQVARILA